MRIVHVQELSAYEAFQTYGLADGDSPFAPMVLARVISILEEMGWGVTQIGGLHNHAIVRLEHHESGRAVDVAEVAASLGLDMEDDPQAVRQALLAAGLQAVVEALDRLDQEEVCEALPSYVLLRHPDQGDVSDVRPFASPQAAARFALAAQEEGEDVEVIIPTGEQEAVLSRYRQIIDDEELEQLAEGSPGR